MLHCFNWHKIKRKRKIYWTCGLKQAIKIYVTLNHLNKDKWEVRSIVMTYEIKRDVILFGIMVTMMSQNLTFKLKTSN